MDYLPSLKRGFAAYRESRFADQDNWFESRPAGGPVVFQKSRASANVLVPPFIDDEAKKQILAAVPVPERHRHFASMQSSQALAQSVFGTLSVLKLLPLLAKETAEDGLPLFGPGLHEADIVLEKAIGSLGEPRPTSVDVWLDGGYRVAIEVKLSEAEFGTCSRPRLRPQDASFGAQYCDGTYAHQRGRSERCALSEIGVKYWQFAPELFHWDADSDQRPCPMRGAYQLVRNVLAACVREDGSVRPDQGHALILYDARNPTMQDGGTGSAQWEIATRALRFPEVLRRISWQSFVAQWPRDAVLDWMKEELALKYGI